MDVTGSNAESYDLNIVRGDTLAVEIYDPEDEVNENNTDYILGRWLIGFEAVYGSYFYKDVDCLVGHEFAAWGNRGQKSDLLTIPLVGNVGEVGTLEAYLLQRNWWSDGREAMSGDLSKAEEFCSRIVHDVTKLGFNTGDAYLAADAVARSSHVSHEEREAMLNAQSCDFLQR